MDPLPIVNFDVSNQESQIPALTNAGETQHNEGPGVIVPTGQSGGETLPILDDISPIRNLNTMFYPIHDEDVSGMDDEILQMQIQLGDVQERNLRRKIESKRRKINSTSNRTGDSIGGLSRDLSIEIDRDRAAQLPEALARIKVLENDKALWAEQVRREREETLVNARAQIQLEMDKYSIEVQEIMKANAITIRNEAEQKHAVLMNEANAREQETIDALKQGYQNQLVEAQSHHETRLRGTEMSALGNHEAEVSRLRNHLQEAEEIIGKNEHQVARLLAQTTQMEEHIQMVTSERNAANANLAIVKPSADATLLRSHLEKMQNDHQQECSRLKAQYNQIEVQSQKLKDSLNKEHALEVAEQLKKFNLREKSLCADIDQCRSDLASREAEISELKMTVEDFKIKRTLDTDDLTKEKEAVISQLNRETRLLREKYEAETKSLRGEIQVLKNTLTEYLEQKDKRQTINEQQSSSSQSYHPASNDQNNAENDEEYDQQDYDEDHGDWYYGEDGEWHRGEDEDKDQGDEHYDDEDPPKEMQNAMMKLMMRFMTKEAKAEVAPKGKEADSIKIPQLPTAAQFKSWKNAVRSAVSSASRSPAEAFKWVMAVESIDMTYERLSECPKQFETLDAKLSSALTQICKGELGRKITLKTESEAKAMKLIRGRQILWIVYEDYRVNEEAGSLNDITDLMKVTIKRDQTKVEQLSRFLMNWETVLAGIKEPPPDNQLQVMFYEQIKHVPSISNDIAMYDRAELDSAERSYQFLVKAVQRVLQRTKRERNRKDIEKSLDNLNHGTINTIKGGKGTKGKGGKAGGKGKGKGDYGGGKARDNNCREWMAHQSCKRGKECIYDHPVINGWKLVAGAKAKAKPRPKGDGKGKNKDRTKQLCKYFAAGNCRNGDKCNDLHEGTVNTVRDSGTAAKAKAKAKANAKAQESGNV